MTRGEWFRKGASNVLIGVDQLANAVIGGDPDETISSRAGKLVFLPQPKPVPLWARFVVWLVSKVDPTHWPRTIEHDEGKDELRGS